MFERTFAVLLSSAIFALAAAAADAQDATSVSTSRSNIKRPGLVDSDGKPNGGNNGTGGEAIKANQPIIIKDADAMVGDALVTGPCKPPYLCGFVWNVQALVKNEAGEVVATARTDTKGTFGFSGLPQGEYEIDIDGPSLVAAMDKLAPAPEKKSSPSFSVGFGGGSSRSSSGTQGAGPVGGDQTQSPHRNSRSSGMGLGFSIPVGGNGDAGPSGTGTVVMFRWTPVVPQLPASVAAISSFETPYCRDSAAQGMRIHFTVPQGAPASVMLSIFDRWGEL